jgi:hypothetical protein
VHPIVDVVAISVLQTLVRNLRSSQQASGPPRLPVDVDHCRARRERLDQAPRAGVVVIEAAWDDPLPPLRPIGPMSPPLAPISPSRQLETVPA